MSYRRSTDEQAEAARLVVAELPDHLIESLLLKLSVKNLMRFCSLSKHWKATITSRTFASLHMKQLREETTSTIIVVSADCDFYNAYAHRISTIIPCHQQQLERLAVIKDHVQVKSSKSNYCYMHQFSSCNGLVCVTWLKLGFRGALPTSLMLVWNPVTGKLKDVSSPLEVFDINRTVEGSFITGFGFDPAIDDYKIVYTFLIICPDKSRLRIIKVMSLKSNTWRSIDLSTSPDLSCGFRNPYPHSQPVTAGGDVYWVVKWRRLDFDGHKILRFKLANEKFELLSFPEYDDQYDWYSKLVCYNDSLYLLHPIYSNEHIIWMLDMKDGNAIWHRVGSIPPLRITKRIRRRIVLEALGFNSSGHVIMRKRPTGELFAYIPKEDKFMNLELYYSVMNMHLVEMETMHSP